MHLEVLVQVEPSAVRARLIVDSVNQPPGGLIRGELNVRLVLRQKLVIDADVTVWGPPNHDFLPRKVLLVIKDLACRGSTKNLQL